jgi:hypothetical protein
LTTEEGQKNLISDIVRQKCAWHPLLGVPAQGVKTFREFQSGTAEVAIISMVWTNINTVVRRRIDSSLLNMITSKGQRANFVFMREALFSYHLDEVTNFSKNSGLQL